jgi:hypothetical protein
MKERAAHSSLFIPPSAFSFILSILSIPVNILSSFSLYSFAQAANLRGVVVRVRGVNPEPVFRRIARVLRVRAFAFPLLFAHQAQELRRA